MEKKISQNHDKTNTSLYKVTDKKVTLRILKNKKKKEKKKKRERETEKERKKEKERKRDILLTLLFVIILIFNIFSTYNSLFQSIRSLLDLFFGLLLASFFVPFGFFGPTFLSVSNFVSKIR